MAEFFKKKRFKDNLISTISVLGIKCVSKKRKQERKKRQTAKQKLLVRMVKTRL